jgi:hypothetical protein
VSDGKIVARITGRALAGVYSVVRLKKLRLARGAYRFTAAFSAPVNRGDTVVRRTRAFSIR